MPSGVNDTIANAVLNNLLGSSAGSTLGATMYLDGLTTAPSDDNGTGAVSWGQGRAAVTVASGTTWPAASGRSKSSAIIGLPANTSGAPIDLVALAFYTASSGGTYLGGGPVPGGVETVPAGSTPQVTATLSSPSPS